MAHNHSHTIASPNDINRSFMVGIALNIIYVIVEIIYGFQQNSTSLLSDAAHNVGDISGLLLAFLAFRLIKIKSNDTFTYGFKKGSIVASFINSVLLAFAIGAAMHGYVPENFFGQYLGGGQWWTVPLAVILAVPMYANAAGILLVIQVFVAKGVPLGTAIAFMMATVGLSIPEATLLKKVMTIKLIAIFFGVVTQFIILSGYLFNILL